MEPTAALRTTPLNALHRRFGAKMVDFGGWDMPVQYSGILDEHHAVRQGVGLFDVSHMGEIEVRGPEALQLVSYVSCNDPAKLKVGQAHYSGLLYEHGGFVDDILVHKVDDDHFFLCVNAANQEKDFDHINLNNRFQATLENAGERYAQIAIQGPLARQVVQKVTPTDLGAIRYYWFTDGEVGGIWARIARTGYTGEDGYEVYVHATEAEATWMALAEAGAELNVRHCGLGCRNTLRLEAKMALYGHEIDATTTPWEADLGWIVKLDGRGDFIGREALERQKERGVTRKLAGFEMRGRGIARDGYDILLDGQKAGWVTSGGPAPTLGKNIGLGYLPADRSEPGQAIEVVIRNQPVEAVVVPTPFYKRAK